MGARARTEEERTLGAALAYAKRGVPVFPCEPGGKRPLTKGGHWDATTDDREIREWWGRWPSANVAIPTGKASNLVVLDVDAGAGLESIGELELTVTGQAPKTLRARTGGGGEHLFFRYPTDGAPEIRNSQGLIAPGLDVRGEGGYVIVSPSRTTGEYRWVDRSPPAGAGWLLEALSEAAERKRRGGPSGAGETLF